MPLFNWNQQILGVPDDWRQTAGAGVKIAIIDSGADLTHPALSHLSTTPHKRFDAARTDFDPAAASNGGDNIADAAVDDEAHGTYCTSILAAHEVEGDIHGVSGLAPEATLLLYKATDTDGESTHTYFLKALQSALLEEVDLISVSYVPTSVRPSQKAQVDALFEQMTAQQTQMFVALDNTNLLSELNDIRYPANRSEVIPVGVVSPKLLNSLQPGFSFNPAIRWLLPKVPVRYCDLSAAPSGPYIDDFSDASTANACLAGVAALLISSWKQAEGAAYRRRTKEELMAALAVVAGRFIPAQLLQNPAFQFVQPA